MRCDLNFKIFKFEKNFKLYTYILPSILILVILKFIYFFGGFGDYLAISLVKLVNIFTFKRNKTNLLVD